MVVGGDGGDGGGGGDAVDAVDVGNVGDFGDAVNTGNAGNFSDAINVGNVGRLMPLSRTAISIILAELITSAIFNASKAINATSKAAADAFQCFAVPVYAVLSCSVKKD